MWTFTQLWSTPLPLSGPVNPATEGPGLHWSAAGARSVCLTEVLCSAELVALLSAFPTALRISCPTMSEGDLVSQLSKGVGLDNKYVPRGGNSKNPSTGDSGEYVRLNGTNYPQPRRVSYSPVIAHPSLATGQGVDRVRLFAYYNVSGELSGAVHASCRALPKAVAKAVLRCWHTAYPHLSFISKGSPPNHVQTLAYYSNMSTGGRMGPHRDRRDALRIDDEKFAMIRGTSVLILSVYEGGGRRMHLHFYTKAGGKGPPVHCLELPHGCLFILDPEDDVRWYHSTAFSKGGSPGVTCRFAVVMRWVHRSAMFDAHTGDRLKD